MEGSKVLKALPKCWLDSDGLVYQQAASGPSPCKDFFHLAVTMDEIVLRVWKIISPYRLEHEDATPKLYRSSFEEFRHNSELRMRVEHFSFASLRYLDNLIAGNIDYICRIDKNLLLRIIDFLDFCSVLKLGATNRFFRELCKTDQVWQRLFVRNGLQGYVTPGLRQIADKEGWKAFFVVMRQVRQSTNELGRGMFQLHSAVRDAVGSGRGRSHPSMASTGQSISSEQGTKRLRGFPKFSEAEVETVFGHFGISESEVATVLGHRLFSGPKVDTNQVPTSLEPEEDAVETHSDSFNPKEEKAERRSGPLELKGENVRGSITLPEVTMFHWHPLSSEPKVEGNRRPSMSSKSEVETGRRHSKSSGSGEGRRHSGSSKSKESEI